ncbi:DExH-box splicing factor binding site-domain-containing protein [Scleroderma yunnanense]
MSNVSFTIRRPTPFSRPSSSGPESDGQFKVPALPRHLTGERSATGSPLVGSREGSDDDGDTGIVFSNGATRKNDANEPDSSDDDASVEKELVTEFDQFSVQRDKKRKAPEPALVIPSLPNPDWREAARKRRAATGVHASRSRPFFVPDSARAATGADGSVGGLGTRDSINSGPQLKGLQVNKRVKAEFEEGNVGMETATLVETTEEQKMKVEETEDQRAIRALLAGGDSSSADVTAIPVPPLTETDALRQDVETLPESATVEDYARVPVSSFGLAMLRGMGWSEGTVASKSEKGKKHGLVEPYLPQARPALLGIGAKEQEAVDDGSVKHKKRAKDKRYIPIVRKDGEESGGSRSGTVSRRTSRSPVGRDGDEHANRPRSRHDDRDRKDGRDHGGRRKDYDGRDHDRDRRKEYSNRDEDRRSGNGYRDQDRGERDDRDHDSRRRRDYREDVDRESRKRRDR